MYNNGYIKFATLYYTILSSLYQSTSSPSEQGWVYTLESRIIVPPRLSIFRFFPPRTSLLPPTPLLLIFSHFCSHFWVQIAIFIIVHHKDKEIVQSSTITMSYVNTKHMLSLWNPIVGMSTLFWKPPTLFFQLRPPLLLLIIITMSNLLYYSNPSYYSGLESIDQFFENSFCPIEEFSRIGNASNSENIKVFMKIKLFVFSAEASQFSKFHENECKHH